MQGASRAVVAEKPAPAPAAARIFGARGKRIQSLYPISRLGSIVISGLFYHRKHTKLDGAIVVHRYIRYIVISGIVISGFDCTSYGLFLHEDCCN